MVIFHSYVSLPEGASKVPDRRAIAGHFWLQNRGFPQPRFKSQTKQPQWLVRNGWDWKSLWHHTQSHNWYTDDNRLNRDFIMINSWIYPLPYLIELDDGKIYRKALYLMVKTMVSCRFSLKPIQWLPHFTLRIGKLLPWCLSQKVVFEGMMMTDMPRSLELKCMTTRVTTRRRRTIVLVTTL